MWFGLGARSIWSGRKGSEREECLGPAVGGNKQRATLRGLGRGKNELGALDQTDREAKKGGEVRHPDDSWGYSVGLSVGLVERQMGVKEL